jgi:hypothetical protein
VGVLLLLAAGRPAVPAPLPLPPEMQEQVNRAIDRGVAFLKVTQARRGTWAAAGAPHQVGYAALPGLTLLECGVSPRDPVIQRTADAVRRTAEQIDGTYEISLAILFLDRLGDPEYEPVIERLALRLIASQAPTGGWGYKCLPGTWLSKPRQQQLLVLLRKLSALPAGPELPLMVPGGGQPNLAGGPAGQRPAAPAGGPARPGDGPPTGGVTGVNDPLRGGPASSFNLPSPGESQRDKPPGTKTPAQPAPAGRPPAATDRGRAPLPTFPSSQWARCIKSDLPPPSGDLAPELRARPPARAELRGPQVPAGPVVIPQSLRGLTVFQRLDWLASRDLPERGEQPLLPTTDNSNSQFAILALWAAQRHGIPMERTLRRVALRYATSQSPNGSWGYHYQHGGGNSGRRAMTCVGLLGLAVGLGLDQAPAGGRAAQDPRLLAGFVALSRNVGVPAGRTQGLPMENLYFLWSVERVAVLYDLQTIGGKDWYRWGAEILVANQQQFGNWADGGYIGSSPVLDTCLALLFLKRANLAADLTRKLPFDPAMLNDSIIGKLAEANRPKDTKPEEAKKTPPPEPPKPPGPPTRPDLTDTTAKSAGPAAPPADDNASWEREEGTARRRWPFVLFGLGVLLLLGAIIFVVIHLLSKKEEEEEEGATARRPASQTAKGTKARPASKLRTSKSG